MNDVVFRDLCLIALKLLNSLKVKYNSGETKEMKNGNDRLKFLQNVRINHMLPYILTFIIAISLIVMLLSGCGSSKVKNDDKNDQSNEEKGLFIDSAVEGLSYITGDSQSFTDAEGAFRYEEGALVSFYIGDIRLGRSARGDTVVTPLNLVSNGTIDDDEVLNIARFLQSLDVDPADDHIKIPISVHALAVDQSLFFSSATFEDDAEKILRIITKSNDYATVPVLVSIAAAKTHLANSLAIEIGDDDDVINDDTNDDDIIDDNTDAGDNTDIPDDGNYQTDDGYGTIQPFTEAELEGDWTATVKNKQGSEYNFYYSFSSDGTGTVTYTPPYPFNDDQDITWEINDEGRILVDEFYNGSTETTIVTRYTNGDVLWTTIEGIVAFKASFTKDSSDDDDDDAVVNTDQFIGGWTVTDTTVAADQTSQGEWTITEKSGSLYATGTWTAFMAGTDYGDITIKFPFSNAAATIASGKLSFTGTGTASTTVKGFKLTSGFKLVVSDATTDYCEYKISVTEDLWNTMLPPDDQGYNYTGTASVVIQ